MIQIVREAGNRLGTWINNRSEKEIAAIELVLKFMMLLGFVGMAIQAGKAYHAMGEIERAIYDQGCIALQNSGMTGNGTAGVVVGNLTG